MAGAHVPLVDTEKAKGAWKAKEGEWKMYLAAKYGKKALKVTAKSVVNNFTFHVGGVIFEAPAMWKTHHHIKRLTTLKNHVHYKCDCAGDVKCTALVEYALQQKKRKQTGLGLSAVPVVGAINDARRTVHWMSKKGAGGNREKQAREIQLRLKNECPLAQALVAELCGKNYTTQEAWIKMFGIAEWNHGWRAIKDKLAS